MKVKELIERLQEYDPEAEVYLAEQPSWPFEYTIGGVVARHEVDDDIDEDGAHPARQASDVFIVEGSHIRYADRDLWIEAH